jgi:hypothetical protein
MVRVLPAVLLLVLAGCGPSGCRVSDPASLLPADSLSRAYAEQLPVLELEPVGELDLTGVAGHPRTIRFSPDGNLLYVGDTRAHIVARIQLSDGTAGQIESTSFRNPYLVGFLGDTLLVLNPARRHIDFMHDGAAVRQIELPDFDDRRTLRYAVVHRGEVYVKSISEEQGNFLSRFAPHGAELERVELDGPHWRYSGMMRSWGDTLVSLSGYRPVVDLVREGMEVDSLALYGFDSPMLSRSRRFVQGDTRNAPLLSASAAPLDDHLWVLNMRPGWIRIDAYDRDGRLVAAYTQPDPTPDRRFYPVDIAARPSEDGSVLLDVLLARPNARVITYRARLPE